MRMTMRFAPLAAALWAAALTGAITSAGATEPARPAGKIEAEYLITWMGIAVYTARLAAAWQDGRYRMQFGAEAVGIARLGNHTTIAWETRGRMTKGALQPEIFEQANTFRRQTRRITLDYPGSIGAAALRSVVMPAVSVVPPESPGKRPPVPDALKADTLDPLSATFAAVAMAPDATACRFAAQVFEGLRRTDVRLDHEGTEHAPVRGAGLDRESLVCLLHAKRLAGYEEKHFRQNPEPLPPAKLWVAKHADSGLWLPVQLRFESSYGPIYARLVRLESGTGGGK